VKIVDELGYYLEEARPKYADSENLAAAMADWPGQIYTLNVSMDLVSMSNSQLNDQTIQQSPLPSFNNCIMFLKNPSGEHLGAFEFSFYQDTDETSLSMFQVYRAAIIPEHRGQGYFSKMYDLIVHFAHCFIGAEKASMITIDTSPQVKHKVGQNSIAYESEPEEIPDLYTQQTIILDFDDFHASLSTHQDADICVMVNDEMVACPIRKVDNGPVIAATGEPKQKAPKPYLEDGDYDETLEALVDKDFSAGQPKYEVKRVVSDGTFDFTKLGGAVIEQESRNDPNNP
jgi:hypothetical protein